MPLIEEFESSGAWLFRWRSYLGFLFVPVLAIGIYESATSRGTAIEMPWLYVCLLLSLCGLAIRVHCVGHAPEGTSGRNTREQIASELNTTGWYSVVRHPLYVGNFFIALGIVMLPANFLVVLAYVLAFSIYYERIMFIEEAFLRSTFGVAYVEWAGRTPAVVPRFRTWSRPKQRFEALKSMERECAALAVVVVGLTSVRISYDWLATGHYHLGIDWLIFSVVSATAYVYARFLKIQKRQQKVDRHSPRLDSVTRLANH